MAMYCGTINAFNPDSVTVSNSNNREDTLAGSWGVYKIHV
jgi:hypothetical protein